MKTHFKQHHGLFDKAFSAQAFAPDGFSFFISSDDFFQGWIFFDHRLRSISDLEFSLKVLMGQVFSLRSAVTLTLRCDRVWGDFFRVPVCMRFRGLSSSLLATEFAVFKKP